MSSSKDDSDHRQTSDPATNNFSETVPRGYPQNHHYPPQQMGYPPAMGYPPPSGQYPPTTNYNPYPYPPAQGYYPSPNSYQHPPHMHHHGPISSQPSPLVGFIRGVLIAIIILIMASCIFSIILYVLLRPMVPEYHVTSFTVTDFNISNGVVAGNWDANITITNPNPNQKINFSRMQAYMYYQNIVNYLSWSTMQGLSLATNSTSSVHVRNTMANQAQPPEWTVKTLEGDWEKGVVKFELGMTMLGTFKGSWWMSHLSLGVYCDDLMVSFRGPKAGSGSIPAGELPKKCMVDA